MGDKSNIQWTDATWNPLRGCTRVSNGCRNCYAEKVAHRFSGPGRPYEGLTTEKGRWNGTIKLVPEKLDQPLRWRRPRRVFVNSMSDLFHEAVPNEYITAVFGVMAAASGHSFQVLTKRPERALAWFAWLDERVRPNALHDAVRSHGVDLLRVAQGHTGFDNGFPGWPLSNVWLGVSVEDQPTADERVPVLLQCPAAVRWVSYEPALGSVDFARWLGRAKCDSCGMRWADEDATSEPYTCDDCGGGLDDVRGLDWVVVGGESGPRARPCNVDDIDETVVQCRDAGVPCFVKQLGAAPYREITPWRPHGHRDDGVPVRDYLDIQHSKGADPSEWPADLRVREHPA